MDLLVGEIVGDIHIVVCKTPDGNSFFNIRANSENVFPVVDILEDTLVKF